MSQFVYCGITWQVERKDCVSGRFVDNSATFNPEPALHQQRLRSDNSKLRLRLQLERRRWWRKLERRKWGWWNWWWRKLERRWKHRGWRLVRSNHDFWTINQWVVVAIDRTLATKSSRVISPWSTDLARPYSTPLAASLL